VLKHHFRLAAFAGMTDGVWLPKDTPFVFDVSAGIQNVGQTIETLYGSELQNQSSDKTEVGLNSVATTRIQPHRSGSR
jgi:hypothetical protein